MLVWARHIWHFLAWHILLGWSRIVGDHSKTLPSLFLFPHRTFYAKHSFFIWSRCIFAWIEFSPSGICLLTVSRYHPWSSLDCWDFKGLSFPALNCQSLPWSCPYRSLWWGFRLRSEGLPSIYQIELTYPESQIPSTRHPFQQKSSTYHPK